jgi:predicted enzyme related to lactoylglutathione lyase
MLRGLTTVSFYADDLEAASRWYAEFLGIEPYFRVPGYVEFRIGDYEDELGIIDRRHAPSRGGSGPAGEIVFWHVDDLAATVDRLISLGASEYEPIKDRGHGFVTASVVDPFGNVLGVMTNPHYLDVLAARST